MRHSRRVLDTDPGGKGPWRRYGGTERFRLRRTQPLVERQRPRRVGKFRASSIAYRPALWAGRCAFYEVWFTIVADFLPPLG
jgi:hypothetical protein